MASTPPSPLPAFAATIFAAPFGLGQKIEHLFEYWYQLAAGDTPEWRRFVMTCEDLVSGDSADDAKVTFDIVNFTGGAIDTSWTDSDYTFVESQLNGLAGVWSPHMNSGYRFSKVDAYRMTFKQAWPGSDPQIKMFPFNLTGPPEHSSGLTHTGSDTFGRTIPQAACSVTEMVPVRASWGRFYLPFAAAGLVDQSTGRWRGSTIQTIADGIHSIYGGLAQQEFYPVIPITQSRKERVAALEQVTALRIDDVPDVIRRRRFKHPIAKVTVPLTTAAQQPSAAG